MPSLVTDNGDARSRSTRARRLGAVSSLEELLGAHPDALRDIYRTGRATDPAELGDAPRGRVLGLDVASAAYALLRPLVRALATDGFPWRGKVFDHGGNAGQNVVFGRTMLRFRTEIGPSDIDGKPTLILHYDSRAFANPWPVRVVRDELRTIAPGIAIGPASVTVPGGGQGPEGRRVVLWFGLQHAPGE